jgi:putative membrane protein
MSDLPTFRDFLSSLVFSQVKAYSNLVLFISATTFLVAMYSLLVFLHVVCFALWMGAVAASMLVIRTLEPRLTNPDRAPLDAELLKTYIRYEVKLVDVAFFGVLLTGVALAHFYIGWTLWTTVKLSLYFVQFGATMFYIAKFIRPLSYPCSTNDYKRWYGLFAVSFSLFFVVLVWTYFGR